MTNNNSSSSVKVYALTYDFKLLTVNKLDSDDFEHRVETFTDIQEFMERVKYLEEHDTTQWGVRYICNLKTYSGELPEIPKEKVLQPF